MFRPKICEVNTEHCDSKKEALYPRKFV